MNTTISIATGISSYVVDYTTRGKPPVHANNGGVGFPMQDRILYYRPLSCVNFGLGQTRVVAAVSDQSFLVLVPCLMPMTLYLFTLGVPDSEWCRHDLSTLRPSMVPIEHRTRPIPHKPTCLRYVAQLSVIALHDVQRRCEQQ